MREWGRRERVGDSRKQIKVGDVWGKEARGELEGWLDFTLLTFLEDGID